MSRFHIGCTLGPVFDTLNKAQTPMEIWLASYMFSRFAQELVSALPKGVDLVSPSADGCAIANACTGIGLYSDHIFFSVTAASKDKAKEILNEAKGKALSALATDMANAIPKSSKDAILTYLTNALYVLPVIREAKTDDEPIPMHELTEELDLQECYPPFVMKVDADAPDYLMSYLENAEKSPWLQKNKIQKIDFGALAKGTEKGDDPYEDYIAIVQADGDFMGSFLGGLSVKGKIEEVKAVSTFLFNQEKKNAKAVKAFGGYPIYFGGDDMLFIAPLFGKNQEKHKTTLWQFLHELSEDFEKEFAKNNLDAYVKAGKAPALSFGVSVCYKKYPLRLMRESAAGALFGDAKTARWSGCREKKAVASVLRKHSGQTSRFVLAESVLYGRQKSACQRFIDLLGLENISSVALHALHWKVMEQKEVIGYLLTRLTEKEREKRLENWLENNFNEGGKPVKEDCEKILQCFMAVADDLRDNDNAQEKILDTIDGIFRLNELMFAKEEKKDVQP